MAFKPYTGNGNGSEENFSIGLNIVLTGSKHMTDLEVRTLLSTKSVIVTIVDAEDQGRILVNQTVDARQFKTGSVGFGLHDKALEFVHA